ncbi:MAG: hypothetical protein P8O06_08920 [Porticoccaceae bacterium]|nr:hypothetical protein [Porticoccaceae bacterium]
MRKLSSIVILIGMTLSCISLALQGDSYHAVVALAAFSLIGLINLFR